jgi:hypothetical protein
MPTRLNGIYLIGCGFEQKQNMKNIWVHEETGFELKEINTVTYSQVCESKEIGRQITFLHELQNRLFHLPDLNY